MVNAINASEILVILGVFSWLLGKVSDLSFSKSKDLEMGKKYFVVLPKWANILCLRSPEKSVDRWSVQFQLGGIVLIVLWLILFILGKEIGGGELFWLGFATYFLVPSGLIRYWEKANQKLNLQ